jgi:hypothetical protein
MVKLKIIALLQVFTSHKFPPERQHSQQSKFTAFTDDEAVTGAL